MTGTRDYLNKAKDFVKGHPDQARDALGKVEGLVDKRTGGKYSEQIRKGGDLVEGQLGIPDQQPGGPQQPGEPGGPLDPSLRPGAGPGAQPAEPGQRAALSQDAVLPEGGPTQQGAGNADGPTPGDPASGARTGF